MHAFSTSAQGSMRRPFDHRLALTEPRRRFAESLGFDPQRLAVAGVVHGSRVARVDFPAGLVEGSDGLITDRPGIPLLATFADCLPIILHDPRRQAVALVHAGWRGTAAGIAAAAVEALAREYGSRPQDLAAGIGPGICGRCYEVGAEVAGRFAGAVVSPSEGGRFLLDLAAANRLALIGAGIGPGRIHLQGACTRETPELPSHRRCPDGARFAGIVGLRRP